MTHAHFHLPGLYEFHELYSLLLGIYRNHREYFNDWCDIGSIYGSPADCIWGGGREEDGRASTADVIALMDEYGISPRLTFSNSLLEPAHLADRVCNEVVAAFGKASSRTGIIIYSDLLLEYLREKYPEFYFVSTTTKVLTSFGDFVGELDRDEFRYVVPDFRLNHDWDNLSTLSQAQRDKVEFLINECCWTGCQDRAACYENVSMMNLGRDVPVHICRAPGGSDGYKFSRAMETPSFISASDIRDKYLPAGFTNFKLEGRGLGSALVLEMIIYYMVKPEFQIHVREQVYLDGMLDLF